MWHLSVILLAPEPCYGLKQLWFLNIGPLLFCSCRPVCRTCLLVFATITSVNSSRNITTQVRVVLANVFLFDIFFGLECVPVTWNRLEYRFRLNALHWRQSFCCCCFQKSSTGTFKVILFRIFQNSFPNFLGKLVVLICRVFSSMYSSVSLLILLSTARKLKRGEHFVLLASL